MDKYFFLISVVVVSIPITCLAQESVNNKNAPMFLLRNNTTDKNSIFEVSEDTWKSFNEEQTHINLKKLCSIACYAEKEFDSLHIHKNEDLLLSYQLQHLYRRAWWIILKYFDKKVYQDEITEHWKNTLKNNGTHYPLLLEIDLQKIATKEEILFLRTESRKIIENSIDLMLFNSFCLRLAYNCTRDNTLFYGDDEIKMLERFITRVDVNSLSGTYVIGLAESTLNTIYLHRNPKKGLESSSVTPLSPLEMSKLGPIVFLSDAALKAIVDAQADYEDKLKKVSELVVDEKGRIKIIAVIGSTNEDQQIRTQYFEVLNQYYLNLQSELIRKGGFAPVWNHEISSPKENEAIRKLLQSTNLEVKQYALQLVERSHARSLLFELLKICSEKEQLPNEEVFFPSLYHFEVYRLLGILGDAKTIRTLEHIRQSDMISAECKEDAALAIADIKRHLSEHQRQKQNWLDLRRSVREKKIFVIGEMIDMDKPDPEPVSPEGFRNWETTDGLFKTMAKFISLKDVKNKLGKVTDQDVVLLRQDGKEVSIEYSALRVIDHEYIRQQLEPFRDWSTVDGKLGINAKLLHKFDTEIILQESDGITTTVLTDQLSEPDKEYLKQISISPHSKYVF
jgi:hypothetical protein